MPISRTGSTSSGMILVGVEHVVGQLVGEFLVERLNAELPFRKVAAVDRLAQIAAVKVIVGGLKLQRLVPQRRLHAELRLPVEFHEGRFALGVDEAERVDAKALHHAKERGIVRSDIAHISMWVVSGISDAKSQNVSCALPACG